MQGSGIGLSLCRFIVEHLKGKIWIDPKYTSGARFVFTHPLENDSHENE
ncbi:ATP-binding protein [Bacteroides faecis]